MEITGYSARQPLIRWAQRVREALDPDSTPAARVADAVTRFEEGRFVLAVLGKAKRGKSTLINALLGRSDDLVAPIDRLPASSAITEFTWRDRESAIVRLRDGSLPATFEEIRRYVTEEENPGNEKGVQVVHVSGPFRGLEPDLVLVDTPGAGSIHGHHDALLHGFLPHADAAIFLVTARMPLDEDELDLLGRLKEADIRKVFFALNKVDESEPDEIESAVRHNQDILARCGLPVGRIHRISARRAFRGEVASSGLPELLGEVRRFLSDEKGRVLSDRFVARIHEAAVPAVQLLEWELGTARKSAIELDAELARLQRERQVLEPERVRVEQDFLVQWNGAVEEFDRSLGRVRTQVSREAGERIDETSVVGVGNLTRSLPTHIATATEKALREPMQRLERSLATAVDQLQARSPRLDLQPTAGGTLAVRGGSDLAAGAVQGTVYAVTGVALTQIVASAAAGLVSIPVVGSTAAAATALLGGPVSLIPLGIGLYVAANGWRLSRIKLKERLYDAARDQVHELFESLRHERMPELRRMGQSLVAEHRLRLDGQLQAIEASLTRARTARPTPTEIVRLERRLAILQDALAEHSPAT